MRWRWRAATSGAQPRLISEYFSQSTSKSWADAVAEEAYGDDDPADAFRRGGAPSGHGGQTEADEDEVRQLTQEETHEPHGADSAPGDE